MAPQKHCCLITSSFRSAFTDINNPTAGMRETDNTKHGNEAQNPSQLKKSFGMIMVSVVWKTVWVGCAVYSLTELGVNFTYNYRSYKDPQSRTGIVLLLKIFFYKYQIQTMSLEWKDNSFIHVFVWNFIENLDFLELEHNKEMLFLSFRKIQRNV